MAIESKLQTTIIKFLKDRGAYVIKTRPGAGTPAGCPDIVFLYYGRWGVIEVKAAEHARMQPGQKATLDFLCSYNPYVYKVWPDNWPEVKCLLSRDFF